MSEDSNEVQDETAGFEVATTDLPVSAEAEGSADEEAAQDLESGADNSEAGSEEDAQSGDDATAENDKGEKPKRKRDSQKRIDKVVRQREDERRKNESLEKRIKELEGQEQKAPVKSEAEGAKEPREDDFDTYDEYLDAVDTFDSSKKEGKKQEAKPEAKDDKGSDEGEGADELTGAQRTAMAVLREKIEGSAEKHADFEKIALDDSVPITGEMIEALAECDDPAKVMMQLGNDKDLAAEIAEKSPAQQMRAIANLDLAVVKKPAKPIKPSKAADPISPVGGSDAQQKNISDMSFSEYEAHMNAKEGRG
jgi:hypothetical protein